MISTIYDGKSVRRSCYLSNSNSGENDEPIQNALLAASSKELRSPQSSTEKMNSIDENEELTILIEIVAATVPKKPRHDASNSLTPQARGIHCTANWIGPVNPSGRKRRETFFHRTKTLKLNGDSDTPLDASPDINTVGKYNHLEEQIFTVEDGSLFLFKTTMKQLVNGSVHDDRMSNGGLKFDIYEKPINILTSSVGNALTDIIRHEKEACATNRESSVSSLLGGSYRLIGTVFLSPQDILSSCDGSRIEFEMVDRLALTRQNGQKPSRVARKVFGGRLVLRMRKASETDLAFMKLLCKKFNFGGEGNDLALLKDLTEGEEACEDEDILPVQLLTEIDEKLIAAQTSFDCMGNVAYVTHEYIRYHISDDTEKKHHTRPYPDPSRKKETRMLTKSQLREECYKPSTKWVHAGSGSLGTVFIEFLECKGLPNTDAGGAVGNYTDAFISAIYGDVLVQTDVIDDSLSPMWPCWSTRAFKFQMSHPSTAIFIAVADYDVGILEHETIGRVAIQLNKLSPGLIYTLTYDLHESSNLLEFGDSVGKITVRIRVEYEEQKMLMASLKPPPQSWVTSKRKKTHKVAKYCTEGPHDEDTFELQLLWSQIDEIWGKKRTLSYMISDMFYSLIFWRDQVQGLPLHSAVVFYLSVNVVERPHRLPSYILFLSGWLMLASLMQRNNHPNPWRRGHSFVHYWNIFVHGESLESTPKEIKQMEGYKEYVKYEKRWTNRLKEDDKQNARQADLYARLQEVNAESNIKTKSKSKLKFDLIDQLLAPKLLYYQQWLSSICLKIRFVRAVFNWSEAEISFFVTLALFGSSFIALFVPWAFLLRWTSRVVAWVFLGPWMRMVDAILHGSNAESRREHEKAKSSQQIVESFKQQHKLARIQRESALKMKAFRKILFGRYNTRVPDRGFVNARHEDIPLPESFAEHLSDDFIPDTSNSSTFYIPGQNLSGGELIPRIGHDKDQYLSDIREEKKLLLSQYNSIADSRRCGFQTVQNNEETQEFELVRSGNDMIYLHAPDLIESSFVQSTSTTPLTESRPKENEVTQKAIRVDLKSKLLSASLSVSIKMKSGETNYAHSEISSVTQTLDDVSNWAQAAIEEGETSNDEGIEIIPVMSGDEPYHLREESVHSGEETSTVFHYVKNENE